MSRRSWAALWAAAILMGGCSAPPLDGLRFHCEAAEDCTHGFVCFEGYCCEKNPATGRCVDDPCVPGQEVCDGRDNDCDGQIDEGLSHTLYQDLDEDGHGDPSHPVLVCEDVAGSGLSPLGDDCDDGNPNAYPGRVEISCDGVDNNCNGTADEGSRCGPQTDQTDLVANWTGYSATSSNASQALSGCGAAGTQLPVSAGAPSTVVLSDSTHHDYFFVYPAQKNANWDLTGQRLRFSAATSITSFDSAYGQPLVFFCQSNNEFARWTPTSTTLGSSLQPYLIPTSGSSSPAGNLVRTVSFTWSEVNWIEVHFNNALSTSSSATLDDFRFDLAP